MNQGPNQGPNQRMNQGPNQRTNQGGCPIENNLNGQEKSRFFNKRNFFIVLGLFFIGLLIYFFITSKSQPNKTDSLIPRLSQESLERQIPLYQPHLSLPSHVSASRSSVSSKSSISARSSLSRSSNSSGSQISSSSSGSSKTSARSGVNPNLIEKLKSISLG
jgi:hypothetical protein